MAYGCCVHPTGSRRYRLDELDFLAGYIIPEDIWYIFPVEVIVATNRLIMVLSPSQPGHRTAPYKEAWHLLLDPDH